MYDKAYSRALRCGTTEIRDAPPFYLAEGYHQQDRQKGWDMRPLGGHRQ